MNSELLYITRKLGYPSSFGTRAGLGDFLEQYPDGVYAENGGGAPIGWESAAVWFGGDSERAASRFERMMSERNELSRLFRTRIAGVLVLTFIYRMKSRMVTAIPFRGGLEPGPPTIDFWGLKLTMPEGGRVILRKNGRPNAVSLEVSTDGENWQPWTLVGTDYSYTLEAGHTLCIRNTSTTFVPFSSNASNYYKFYLNSDTYASGSVMSLSCNDEYERSLHNVNFNFTYLFHDQMNLLSMPEFTATTLSTRCYFRAMHRTGIEETTILPAENIPSYAYGQMFANCSNLRKVTTLMKSILSDSLDNWLFSVGSGGDLYCPSSLTIPSGISGIPNSWTRHDI